MPEFLLFSIEEEKRGGGCDTSLALSLAGLQKKGARSYPLKTAAKREKKKRKEYYLPRENIKGKRKWENCHSSPCIEGLQEREKERRQGPAF